MSESNYSLLDKNDDNVRPGIIYRQESNVNEPVRDKRLRFLQKKMLRF